MGFLCVGRVADCWPKHAGFSSETQEAQGWGWCLIWLVLALSCGRGLGLLAVETLGGGEGEQESESWVRKPSLYPSYVYSLSVRQYVAFWHSFVNIRAILKWPLRYLMLPKIWCSVVGVGRGVRNVCRAYYFNFLKKINIQHHHEDLMLLLCSHSSLSFPLMRTFKTLRWGKIDIANLFENIFTIYSEWLEEHLTHWW